MGRKSRKLSFRSLFNSWTIIGYAWLLACVLQIIAVATPYWGKATLSSGVKYNEGLWLNCRNGNCSSNKLTREDPTNPGFQVQSLEIPGLVLIIVMACHWWMAMTREIRSHVQDWIFVVLALLGDILILSGIAIYGRKNVILGAPPRGELQVHEAVNQITFDASFILACIVFVISTSATVGGVYMTVQHHIIRRAPWKYRP